MGIIKLKLNLNGYSKYPEKILLNNSKDSPITSQLLTILAEQRSETLKTFNLKSKT